MGRLLEVVKSILTWLDRLHPVFKIFLVIAVLFPRSPLSFPPLSVYLVWRWTSTLNKLFRVGIVGVSVLVTISWFSGLYHFDPSPEQTSIEIAPEEKLVEKEKEIENLENRLKHNSIVTNRDYPFCIYPESRLGGLFKLNY